MLVGLPTICMQILHILHYFQLVTPQNPTIRQQEYCRNWKYSSGASWTGQCGQSDSGLRVLCSLEQKARADAHCGLAGSGNPPTISSFQSRARLSFNSKGMGMAVRSEYMKFSLAGKLRISRGIWKHMATSLPILAVSQHERN